VADKPTGSNLAEVLSKVAGVPAEQVHKVLEALAKLGHPNAAPVEQASKGLSVLCW
jgi:hypothetical protein